MPVISNFLKIQRVGAGVFHVDGRTDMMKLTVAFRNFAEVPKMADICGKCMLYVVMSEL